MAGEALIGNEQLFRTLIEQSPEAITLIIPDGTIIYANHTTEQITGYPPEELVGMNLFLLLHHDDQQSLREQINNLIEHAELRPSWQYRLWHKDGPWRWIEGTTTNLLDVPEVSALMYTFHDNHRYNQFQLAQENRQLTAEIAALHRAEQEAKAHVNQLATIFRDSERKFRSLVESNIVGVMVTDQEGRMYEVNGRLIEMLGYSQEELVNGNMRVKDVLVARSQGARTRAWRTLIAHGASLPEEKEYKRKDGSSFPALVAAATINQERTRALVMLLGISDRRETERRKQEFLSMVSHELRTPLTVIQGFLELALWYIEHHSTDSSTGMPHLLSKLAAMLQQAQRQTEIETRLVAELLDVSRMEMQKFEVALRPCNLTTIVQQVVANQQQVNPDRHIELCLPDGESESSCPLPVMADPDRIEQVVVNYLTNAFKFSPSNQVIRVTLTVEGLTARVSVCDQGPGLTLEQQQQVWDRFYQAEFPRPQGSEGGLGLGLYIVRTIIAQHQGQVGVESQPGQGATFWFMLPLADEPVHF